MTYQQKEENYAKW
jgi:hypothetical protein